LTNDKIIYVYHIIYMMKGTQYTHRLKIYLHNARHNYYNNLRTYNEHLNISLIDTAEKNKTVNILYCNITYKVECDLVIFFVY